MQSIRSKLSKGKSLKSIFQQREKAPVQFLSFNRKSDFTIDSVDLRQNESEFPTESTPLGLESNLNFTRNKADESNIYTASGPMLALKTFLPEIAFEVNPFPMKVGWGEVVTAIVPGKNPLLWMIIDGVLLFFTTLFSLGVLLFPGSELYISTMQYFAGYTLFNSFMLILQILLDFWYKATQQNLTCSTPLKLCLAVYLGYEACGIIIKKDQERFLENYDCTSDLIFINLIYLYLFLECHFKWRTQDDLGCLEAHFSRPEIQSTNISSPTTELSSPYLTV